MIRDLQLADDDTVSVTTQICIIGAGTAGIFLARRLRRQGLQVVMLEAGSAVAQKPEELDQLCEQRGICYRGAQLGRSFGLGGTSVLWGGQMLPLARTDIEARPEAGFEAWPLAYNEIAPYFQEVRRELGLGFDSAYSVAEADLLKTKFSALREFGADFDLRLSTWLPFKKRNFATMFSDSLNENSGLTVWLNASVVRMVRGPLQGRSRIESVIAQSPNRKQIQVHASLVVVCAGALESTRLLLAYDEDTGGAITLNGAPLGRFFADHLSVTCGRLVCRDWRRYNFAVAPIFHRGLMRTPRLELSSSAQKSLGLTSAFAHFTFVTHGNTGFDVVRSILRRRQGEKQEIEMGLDLLGRVVSDVSAMAIWRGLYRRLWIPRQADLLLQVDVEQTSNADSRLTLTNTRDALNRKRLAIDWSIKSDDIRVIRKVTDLTISAWRQSKLRDIADVQLTLPRDFDAFESLYDVYHPTGSLRMGSSAANSVVDKNLCVWATDNCYVATTAVFPSAGSANPGMTHLALTARLAEHIGKRLQSAVHGTQ